MSTNIGVSPAECWAVNLEDGSVKNILSATVEGLEGRFDYFRGIRRCGKWRWIPSLCNIQW